MTPSEALDLPLTDRGAQESGAETVRGYLVALLAAIWREKEGFSGKRPFGNSGWDYDLAEALIAGGAIEGSLDEDGYVESCDDRALDRVVAEAIRSLA